jgi:multimeric flavodoxin WrbA
MLAADGIIIGVPVYFQSLSPQAKAIVDRTSSETAVIAGLRKLNNG